MEYWRHRRNRRIGNRYEFYINHLLQEDGWDVLRRGQMGVHDRGIDLIATKNHRTRYVQCKGWSPKAEIHENVIDQLLGSVVYQEGIENIRNVEMYIYSPAEPSDYTKAVADKLNITIVHEDFPKWKRKHQYL